MKIHNLDDGNRVITLDRSQQFVFTPPGTEDQTWYATKADTVTVFAPHGDTPGYYTIAGDQIAFPGTKEEAHWVLPIDFTDSGPLPPHVREWVEDIVPVTDTPDTVIGPTGASTTRWDTVRMTGGDEHPSRGADQDAVLKRSQRRANFELLDGEGQAELLAAHRPSEPGRPANVHRDVPELQVQPLSPHRPVPQPLPPSAYLNTAQVREGR